MVALNTIDIDRDISSMRLASKELISISNNELASIFQECIDQIPTFADYWVELETLHKKVEPDTSAVGEQWAGGPWLTVWGFRYLIESLKELPNINMNFDKMYDKNRHTLQVFPTKFIEKLLYMGVQGYIKLRNNMTIDDFKEYRGFESRINTKNPTTTLVLGAGNQSCIPILDFAHHIVTRRSPVVLKLNPVNDYLKPVLENILAPFIKRRFLTIVNGDAELGKYLTNHQGISHIHLTGSSNTYENIVYGKKLSENEIGNKSIKKVNNKSITTELGNVTPVIVIPDRWSKSDIKVQAKKIATAKLQNAGFNCIAAQVVVIDKNWKQKDQLIDEVKKSNPNVNNARKMKLVAEEELKLALKEMSLSVDIQASANQAWDPNTFFEEQRYFDVSAKLKMPLYKGGKDKATIRKFREKLNKSNAEIDDRLRKEAEKAMLIWNNIESLNSQIAAFKSSIRANEIALDGVVQEENVGARTVIDVLDAENELFMAKANLIRANINRYIANYELLEVIGGMTARGLGLPVSSFYDSDEYYNKMKELSGNNDMLLLNFLDNN